MRPFYLCGLAVLVYLAVTAQAGHISYSATKPNNEWWANTIMYQVYPRSFKDSNKDGIGDLKGITHKLDHFVDLGIETLWIGPFFKSPQDDMGYDVEDFKMIDPMFGTMQDLEELVFEMKKRNLKLITDLIPNHSSYKSEWFEKSKKKIGKYSEYYVWRNASNQAELTNSSIEPIPPNNWLSVFGGSGWTWDEGRKQFYFHQFSPKQPDFNIRNPDVQAEILDIIKFWMDKGVVGFRFDAVKHLFESDTFLDEPYLPGTEETLLYGNLDHIYTVDQPEVFDILYTWREFMDNYTRDHNAISSIIATESYSPIDTLMQYYGNKTNVGAHIPFNFGLLDVTKDNLAESVNAAIDTWLSHIPDNMVANWVMENHDKPRISTKFSPEMVPIFTALKLSLPGIDVTYYGGEIGMENTYVRPEQMQDATNPLYCRDPERSPMQWDDSINAGFTEEKVPWLPVNPNYYKLNVENQKKIPTSNYNFYKKMSQLRKTETLKRGDLNTYSVTKSIYILKRSLVDHESYLVVANVGSETEIVVLSDVISNLNDTLYVYLGSENSANVEGSTISPTSGNGNKLELRPQSVVVLTDKIIEKNVPPMKHEHEHNGSTEIGSKLIYLLGALLFTRLIL